jgi:hypothetical protein
MTSKINQNDLLTNPYQNLENSFKTKKNIYLFKNLLYDATVA